MSAYSSIFYKGDQRTTEVEEAHQRFSTHTDRSKRDAQETLLECCDDIVLSPGCHMDYPAQENRFHMMLPVTGSLACENPEKNMTYVTSEEVLFTGNSLGVYRIQNPFKNKVVNYLQFSFRADAVMSETRTYSLNFKEYNTLVPLPLDKIMNGASANIGIFHGRAKGTYTLKKKNSEVFLYVINGAFEAGERLMEHRDGLSLWKVEAVDFEALSEFAILLIIETPLIHS